MLIKGIGIHNDVIQVHKQYLKDVIVQTGLHKPLKGRGTVGQTHRHSVVLEEVLCLSSSSVATWLNPLARSIVENHLAPPMASIDSSILGKGNWSLTVLELRRL